MKVRIGILSDTHGFLDESLLTHFADCDEIWHGGDFGAWEVYSRLKAFKPIRGVYGNVDGEHLRSELPEALEWETEGLRVFMTHIGGHPGRYERDVRNQLTARKPDIFICGHSHILRVERDEKLGLTYVNPGACGHQGWHTQRTALRVCIEQRTITAIDVVKLGPRGSRAKDLG